MAALEQHLELLALGLFGVVTAQGETAGKSQNRIIRSAPMFDHDGADQRALTAQLDGRGKHRLAAVPARDASIEGALQWVRRPIASRLKPDLRPHL